MSGLRNEGSPVCDWCGTAEPRWLKWVDQSLLDYAHRMFHGMPGPTAKVVRACDACLPKLRMSYPSDPDRDAMGELRRELETL